MTVDRRKLIRTLGLVTAGSAYGGHALAFGKDPIATCLQPGPYIPADCKPNMNSWVLLYPEPKDDAAATAALANNFKAGLAWALAPSHDKTSVDAATRAAQAYTDKFETSLKNSYAGILHDKIVADAFNETPPKMWVTVNDHAFILGQLVGTMRLDTVSPLVPANKKPDLVHRDYLRAQSRLMQAVSSIHCACFSAGADAFAVPLYPPDTTKAENKWMCPSGPCNWKLTATTPCAKTSGQIDEDCPLCT